MGAPYSKEVKAAVDHAAEFKFAVIFVSIALTIFLCFITVAVIALLITVNPDLVEERKELVTPVLKLGLWCLTLIIWGTRTFVESTEMPREERWRDEGRGENESQTVHDSGRCTDGEELLQCSVALRWAMVFLYWNIPNLYWIWQETRSWRQSGVSQA